jgi:hypothetical protein
MARRAFRSELKEPGAEGSVPPCLINDMTQQNLYGGITCVRSLLFS